MSVPFCETIGTGHKARRALFRTRDKSDATDGATDVGEGKILKMCSLDKKKRGSPGPARRAWPAPPWRMSPAQRSTADQTCPQGLSDDYPAKKHFRAFDLVALKAQCVPFWLALPETLK